MGIVRAVRRIQFCAGHRVHQHESKCRNLHGHNYVVFFHASAAGLDSVGRVIDFAVLKEKLGGWIDQHWDHGLVLWTGDEEAIGAGRQIAGQKLYLLTKNPTAENMAMALLHEIAPSVLKGSGITITKVVLWETENSFAEVESDAW